jgi:hypothetical protein
LILMVMSTVMILSQIINPFNSVTLKSKAPENPRINGGFSGLAVVPPAPEAFRYDPAEILPKYAIVIIGLRLNHYPMKLLER